MRVFLSLQHFSILENIIVVDSKLLLLLLITVIPAVKEDKEIKTMKVKN